MAIFDRLLRSVCMKTRFLLLITLVVSLSDAMADKNYTPDELNVSVKIQDAEYRYTYNNAPRVVPLKIYSPEQQ